MPFRFNPFTDKLDITQISVLPPGVGIQTITGNSGGPVGPDLSNNLNLLGSGQVVVTGNPGTNTLTISLGAGIATTYTANSGSATPALNNLNLLGAVVAAGTSPFSSSGAGSTITYNVQRTQAIAASDATKIGLAVFDSTAFTVDANGFVSLSTTGIGRTITGNSGGALSPTAGNWNIVGGTVVAGSTPVATAGLVSTLTINVQRSQAIVSTDSTKIGLSAFDSAKFTVDANGFVSASGTGIGQTITGDTGGALSPTGGNWNILGSSPVAGTAPVQTTGTGSTLTVNVQKSQALAAADATKVGLSNFNSAQFTVDATGFVSALGSAFTEKFAVDANTAPGTNPVLPSAAGQVTVTGAQVAAAAVGANVIRTNSLAANTYTIEIQRSAAVGASASANNGVSHFNSAQFTVDSNAFVSLKGSGTNPAILGVHPNATSGGGTDPTIADASGNISLLGATVVAGTNPIRTVATAVNSITTQVQISQALAATDATKIGLANFNSAQFSVDANGFVSSLGAGFVWIDQATGTTLVKNTGYFVTAATTQTLPASPSQGDVVKVVADTTGAIVVTANTGQTIRIGNLTSSVAGTMTSTLRGDSLELVFRSSTSTWISISTTGTWLAA